MTHYLSQHAKFDSKGELDRATQQHLDMHWNKVNKTDHAVLKMIHNHSTEHLAAHLKHETFERALKKSNSTIRRTICKLIDLNIIKRIHYVRPVMSGLGPNIYVILPVIDEQEAVS